MRRTTFCLGLYSAFIVIGCNLQNKNLAGPQEFSKDVDLQETGTSPEKIAGLDSLLLSFVDSGKVSCVTAFVSRGGNVVYHKAFGWKDIENRVPASVNDYYILFSQTKAITTVAFMTLVEKGLVAIDDPVSKYFPEIPGRVITSVNADGTYETRPVVSPMTFVHLMSHTSGIGSGLAGEVRRADRRKSGIPDSYLDIIKGKIPDGQHSFDGNPDSRYLEEEMLELVKYPLGFDPGTRWDYHVSTNMLGYMIERISGKTLREYVKETVLDPLGMENTDWYYGPEAASRFVKAYTVKDGKIEPASNMFSEGSVSKNQTYCEGALGLNGPIEDYARFCQMLLNKGSFNGHRILKPETIELMTTVNRLPQPEEEGNYFQFGLGFEIFNENKKPVAQVSDHAFAWGGMLGTQYIVDPGKDLIALFYINMFRSDNLYPLFLGKAYGLF